MRKMVNTVVVKRKFVCIACNCDLKDENEACQNITCQEFKRSKANANKISPYYINLFEPIYLDNFKILGKNY